MQMMKQTLDECYFFYQWKNNQLWSVEPIAGHLALTLKQVESLD